MSKMVRLTCTIFEDDYREENIFLRSYFPVLINERFAQTRKYYSLATRESCNEIMQVLEKELEQIGITNYAFNITTDYQLISCANKQ